MATYEIEQFTEGGNTYKYVDAAAQAALANKVDKVTGKGLSTNDFTNELKTKLDGIESGAQVNPTIDSVLSESSTNAVQNKVITAAVSGTKTATGNPITLTDAAEINAEEVVASIEPIQDLHGYDKPWVGGAGKNKLNITANSYSGAINFDVNEDKTIRIHGSTSSSSSDFTIANNLSLANGNYIFSFTCEPAVSANTIYIIYRANSGEGYANFQQDTDAPITISGGELNNAYIRVAANKTVDTTIKIMVRPSTESDSTFAPYTNICPISGLTSVDVESVGKNLFDPTGAIENCSFSDGIYTLNTSPLSNTSALIGTIMLPVGTYKINGGYSNAFRIYINIDGNNYTSSGSDVEFTVTKTGTYNVHAVIVSGVTTGIKIKPMIRLATVTDATFAPYKGSTTTTPLGRTVYGGTLNVTTGELTVDRVSVDLGDLSWIYGLFSGKNYFLANLPSAKPLVSGQAPNAVSSCYKGIAVTTTSGIPNPNFVNGTFFIWTSPQIYLMDLRFTDAEAFKTAVTGQTLVYEIATPTTYQLTTAEVALLADYCTVSTNADELSVEYWIDNSIGTLIGKIQSLEARVKALEEA